MAGNRKAAEAVLMKHLGLYDKTGENVKNYAAYLAGMNDAAFDAFVTRVEKAEEYIQMKVPNFKDSALSFEKILEVADKVGFKFFERVWITDRATGITHLSPHEYMIIVQPLRRQSQSLMGKMSTAEDNSHIDTLTDQPTGESKTSSLSFVETQVVSNQGIKKPLEELLRVRGGNLKALARFEQQFLEGGSGSLDAPGMEVGKVKSVQTTAIYLRAMHLDNNFDK
jgi:hypothetical protein